MSGRNEAVVLAIVEALRGYVSARADAGLSAEALAKRWFDEQLLPPEREDFEQALRFMRKTRRGHERVPRRLI